MNKRLTITYLLAELNSLGFEVQVMAESDARHGIGYTVVMLHLDGLMGGTSMKFAPGDDEQLRAALQGLVHQVRLMQQAR